MKIYFVTPEFKIVGTEPNAYVYQGSKAECTEFVENTPKDKADSAKRIKAFFAGRPTRKRKK